jgi:putative DNA methylase
MTVPVIPFSLKDGPALIERILPVQKLSAEVYKEQMAVHGKTLTALGSYWKGRKPLILNKACILGCLLPATDDLKRDLEIFEKLMGIDILALMKRLQEKNNKESRFFLQRHSSVGIGEPYKTWVKAACRPEEVGDELFNEIWDDVNSYLKTSAHSFTELVEQLGIMRFGHRPRFADTFCGSGQIPFEAARLGCNVYASDLNPVACMLTWGTLNIVGGSNESREKLAMDQQELVHRVQTEIDKLDVESDGNGWRAKVFLYCVEVLCPQTGWMVPLLPTRVVSKGYRVIAELVPDSINRRYLIQIRTGASEAEMQFAETGTVGREGKYGEAYLIHQVDGVNFKTKISTLRGDYLKPDGSIDNRLRLWEKHDFMPRPNDIFQERLYAIQWARPKRKGKGEDFAFRSVTPADLKREHIVEDFIAKHLADWQIKNWIPDMRIEVGGPPRYQGLDLIRSRGWTHWHHLFNARQLLVAGLIRGSNAGDMPFVLGQVLNVNARLTRWNPAPGPGRAGATSTVFDNQALNTIYNYGCRATAAVTSFLPGNYKHYPLDSRIKTVVTAQAANKFDYATDIFVTDPPYGDAVKYEEILDFFIAWLRKNPPSEFADWVWDSRRSLAIKGDAEDFRHNMVAAYKKMTECMPDNGIQVIMFTHQSGSIWADMANIVWASGLQVTAAWYVVTETDSALREGSYVKGTVLLVLRKRQGVLKTTRDELAWDIQDEVQEQVRTLTGLNQEARGLYRDENVFEDSDLQMAGYAAALRVLTRYAIIDGRDMTIEAIRPRVKGETTFVDDLIVFAVDTANQCLVPQGIAEKHWKELSSAERFYLKLTDLEAKGLKTLDNYQNFAKAFKVRDFHALMGSQKANHARLKSAVEFGRTEMSVGSELHQSVLRAVLYAVMELVNNIDGAEVLAHLTFNVSDYYGDATQRERVVEVADYLAKKLEMARSEEASAARVLRELVKNQRLG